MTALVKTLDVLIVDFEVDNLWEEIFSKVEPYLLQVLQKERVTKVQMTKTVKAKEARSIIFHADMPLDLVITGGYFPIDAYYNCSDFILDVRKLPTTGGTYFIGFSSIWEQCSKEVISSLTSPGSYTLLEDWKSLEKELLKFVAHYILAPPKQKANKPLCGYETYFNDEYFPF